MFYKLFFYNRIKEELMFNKKIDKFIAGTLVATNILGVSAATAINNDRKEAQSNIANSMKTY